MKSPSRPYRRGPGNLSPLWATLSAPVHFTVIMVHVLIQIKLYYLNWKISEETELQFNSVELKPVTCPLSFIDVDNADEQ